LRILQIRPREWAMACCCFGVGGCVSAGAFVERVAVSCCGGRGTERSPIVSEYRRIGAQTLPAQRMGNATPADRILARHRGM
jgi:hypothetical protein